MNRQIGSSIVLKLTLSPILVVLLLVAAPPATAQNMVITGVIDGPLSGGIPKAIEVCVLNDVADLSTYGLGSANNGNGGGVEEFTFPAGPASAGTFLYVASEAIGFSTFFGFAPTFTSGAAAINGDDAIELFSSGAVSDVFGDINTDGSGQPWEYLDGWAYRSDGTGPDGTAFTLANWSFSGPNALDGETSNGSAATPFPIGAYSACELQTPAPDLLLSEIVVTPTAGEFIEIFNPTGTAIDLSDVYLTDATFAGGGTYYYNIVTGADAGGGGFGDFHARFPDGAMIAPGEFQTVSLAGSDGFFAAYGFDPTYELYEDGAGADAVPDMREALPGSINNQGGLTNGGEVVILYTWDGASDLVQDIDYAVWGDKVEAVDKTGVAIDGPDGEAVASDYLSDTAIAIQDVVSPGSHSSGDSFQRTDFNEGTEVQTAGNGVTGSDETSEDLSVTWSVELATPGAGPAADWVINEINADPDSTAGDANGDGGANFSEDEFVEIINTSGAPLDISGWTLADGFTVRHTFPAGTVIPDQCGVVVFGGGAPSGSFGNMTVQTATGGSLGLNNGGDNITLNNGSNDVAVTSYGSEGGDNQSLTLDPDITGATFVKHSVATGSGGALYSPGTKIDGSQFAGCPSGPSGWVINEIHVDPASGDAGDANGDGTRDFSDDEFVEIVNTTGGDVDISGWTLADGFSVRHTFPADTVVFDGCSIVVFGGGAPTGSFGNSLVQTASSNALGLNNGGDDITLNNSSADVEMTSYGSEGGDNQSITLDPDVTGAPPYVKHSVATGSSGALFSPGTIVDGSQFAGCPVVAAVYEIQGSGATSPLEGSRVIATGIVTALAPDGFFMQMSDGDDDTSDGIFVFIGEAPSVEIGDEVEVEGVVNEFFDFTEIVVPVVSVLPPGTLQVSMPQPVVFGANVPSPDSASPSCSLEFECYEGMLVEIADGTVTGPNQRFNVDPVAEVHITAAPARTFREPGIEYPGLNMPPIPTWDGNPEVFELDPDKLGLENQIIPAGSSFSSTGVLGYEFGGYELWPTSLDVTPATLPKPVRAREAGEFTVGTLNLFRLFDDVDDPMDGDRNDFVVSAEEYQRRLSKFSGYIRTVLGAPDILAVQEVESLRVLEDLAAEILADSGGDVAYTARLIEGNDIGTIDVGFLVRDNINVDAISQVDPAATFVNPITHDEDILHDRPPLLLEGSATLQFGTYPIAVMVVHNRSLGGIDGDEALRVRVKRLLQAESIAMKVQDLQSADPNVRLIVAGDFNGFEFTDGYVDVLGIITGNFDPLQSLVCHDVSCLGDVVEPNLDNQVLWVPDDERYSFIFGGSAQVLDHALTTTKLANEISGVMFGRGNADAAVDLINYDGLLRSSDHDGLVVYISNDADADGVPNDDDVCPATVLPEAVPTERLETNRYADTDGDGVFDTTAPKGKGPKRSFDLGDTAGCSCEQIIEAKGLGKGHTKFGCSIGAMRDWVSGVTS